MHKIGNDTATADSNDEFTEGNPITGTPATVLAAAFLNTIQRELAAVVEGAGLALDPNDDTQLLQALVARRSNALILKHDGGQTLATHTNTAVIWNSAIVDTLGMWSAGTDIVIPAGVSKIRVHAVMQFATNNTGSRSLNFTVNDTYGQGQCGIVVAPAPNDDTIMAIHSMDIDVTPGDVVKIMVMQKSGGNLDTVAGTSCNAAIEVIA